MTIDLMTVAISASISGLIGLLTLFLGYWRHRNEMQVTRDKVYEELSLHLVRARVEPYTQVMRRLKQVSSYGPLQSDDAYEQGLQDLVVYIHDCLYNTVGMLASHDTRQFLRLARLAIGEYLGERISKQQLKNVIWALHFSLRGDLGVKQPQWDSEIELIHKKRISHQRDQLSLLLDSNYWDFIEIDSVFSRTS